MLLIVPSSVSSLLPTCFVEAMNVVPQIFVEEVGGCMYIEVPSHENCPQATFDKDWTGNVTFWGERNIQHGGYVFPRHRNYDWLYNGHGLNPMNTIDVNSVTQVVWITSRTDGIYE